jgi:putative ABC transport system ATP-binding protein/lipoprotein-releasing system ATP-binding protein
MLEPLVEANGLSKSYLSAGGEPVVVLGEATCAIMPGDRISLEGASGGGKSTLLTIVGGLASPSSGEIRWPALGDRSELQPLQVAFVFQSPSLFPPLTILQNITLPLVLAGRQIHSAERAQRLLDLFGLSSLSEKLPEELSGGQAQRVAMIRALIVRPKLLIADEPTGQIDTDTAASFLDTVLGELSETPAAIVLATHDRKIADRMQTHWTMDHGTLSTNGERP